MTQLAITWMTMATTFVGLMSAIVLLVQHSGQLHEIHVMVNSRLDIAINEITKLKTQVENNNHANSEHTSATVDSSSHDGSTA